jgi:acyl dehydratase
MLVCKCKQRALVAVFVRAQCDFKIIHMDDAAVFTRPQNLAYSAGRANWLEFQRGGPAVAGWINL